MAKKLTTEEFIQKAKEIHGDKYTYNKVKYKNYSTKVGICCPKHGMFYQVPSSHLKGLGCPKCGKEKNIKTKEQFIKDAINIHGNLYDYSLVLYKDSKTKIKIKCTKCGNIFEQTPNSHLSGQNCPICAKEKIKEAVTYTQEEWINKANKIHNNKYDYSLVNYKNSNSKIIIICPIHGKFEQKPVIHLQGCGCPECAKIKQGPKRKTTEEFIQDAIKKHGNKYDYSKTLYKNCKSKVIIICPKHGEFQMTPSSHLRGSGCPKCQTSKGELFIKDLLENSKTTFEYQKVIEYNDITMRVDFYLEVNDKKYIIEYNGQQHYFPIEYFGGEKQFQKQQLRDQLLREYCNISKISLVEIKYKATQKEISNFINNLIKYD